MVEIYQEYHLLIYLCSTTQYSLLLVILIIISA